jgi:hypothetical protein
MTNRFTPKRYVGFNRQRRYRVRGALVTLMAWLFSVVLTSAHAATMTALMLGGAAGSGDVISASSHIPSASIATPKSMGATVPCHEPSQVATNAPATFQSDHGAYSSQSAQASDGPSPASNICKQHCALDHQSLDTPTSKPPFHAVLAVLTVENAPSMGVFVAKVVEMPISWASSPIYLTSARLRP